jgi:DNA-binding PadR family transcriptional regulator
MNKKPVTFGMDAILTGSLVQSKHVLFLYTSGVNKYAVQSLFFAMSSNDEKPVYVTYEQPELIVNKFENLDLSVIRPENAGLLKIMGDRLRIIMDMALVDYGREATEMVEYLWVHKRLEEFLTENKNNSALCMYDLSKLEPEFIQKLVASHDRLILNTPDITFLSGEKLDAVDATIERFVRDYLDIVVLALISSKPMCGTDILDIIHRNFNILLSPGTIYPLLHRLKEEGLLECECSVKKKVYKPAKGSEANIRRMLDEHSLANELLNDFLKSRNPCVHQNFGVNIS